MRSRNALVLLTLLAAVPVLAAEEPTRAAARQLATLHITPDTVNWEAPAGLGELELAVAGPDGVVVRRRFAAGETPTFDLFNERGERRPDGVYTYEVRSARELRPGRSLLLSGSLAIRDGSFVGPEALDERPSKGLRPIFEADTVIPDDLIVNGNTCLGFECVDGTPGIPLIVKHTSPRIMFEDTGGGVSGTHDWEILINGAFGEESFKIFDDDSQTVPFTLTGSAPSHSLFVSSTGNVGLGTSTPAVQLDVKGSASGAATARLQNSSATGYSGTEYLNNAGTVSLFFGLDNAASTTRFNSVNSYPIVILTNSTERIRFPAPGGNVITAANGASLSAGGTWTNASSRELKRDIIELSDSDALKTLQGLTPVTYRYTAEPDEQYVGFIAEDVPDLVATNDRKHMNPMDVVAILTKVVQEQQKTIDELSARLADLEGKQK